MKEGTLEINETTNRRDSARSNKSSEFSARVTIAYFEVNPEQLMKCISSLVV